MDSFTFFLERTFLIERLLGVLLYAVVIGCSYISLRQSKTYAQFKKAINICLLVLCVMAFFYVPAETADLYRIRTYIKSWESMSFDYWSKVILTNTNSPGAYYLYFLMSRIKIEGLLPALSCFVVFGNIFHIFKEEKRIERTNSASLAMTFFFLMAQGLFLGIISGTRNGMAFSLVARAIYDDFCLDKNKVLNYVLCLVAVSLHIAAVPVVAIYLLFTIYHSWHKSGIAVKLFNIVVVVGIVYWAITRRSGLIDLVISKAETYTTGTVYSYIWERLIVSVSFAMLLVILLIYRKYYKESSLRTVYLLVSILSVGVLLLVLSYSMFHRYANFVMFVSVPVMANCMEKEMENGKFKPYSYVKLVSVLVLLLACVRGDLCGYKFFLL